MHYLQRLAAGAVLPLVLGQATGNTICFQQTSADSPDPSTLAGFLAPAISAACDKFGAPQASAEPAQFNSSGYLFVRFDLEGVTSRDECASAFGSIVGQCVQPASSATYFGGQWSPNLKLFYLITNVAYPKDPLNNSQPQQPASSTTQSTLTITSRTSSSSTTSTTAPPVSNDDPGDEAIAAASAIAAAAAFCLAFAVIPGVNLVTAVAAVAAVEAAAPGKQAPSALLPIC